MEKVISLAHGDGGELSHRLVQDLFVKAFKHNHEAMFDAAILELDTKKLPFQRILSS